MPVRLTTGRRCQGGIGIYSLPGRWTLQRLRLGSHEPGPRCERGSDEHNAGGGSNAVSALTAAERKELEQLRRVRGRLESERDLYRIAAVQKGRGRLCRGRDARFGLILSSKSNFPISLICRWLAASRSAC